MSFPRSGYPLAQGLAAALTVAALTAAARAGDPALDMWQAQRNTFESYIGSMKPIAQHHINDVMQIRLDKKFLVLRTPLTNIAAEQSMRASFEGVRGMAIVSLERDDHDDGPAEPTHFSLAVMDFPTPKQTATISVSQSNPPSQLTLSRTVQTINGPLLQVSFVQNKSPQSSGAGLVRLMITEVHAQDLAPEQLDLSGTDFSSFIREHPLETERYLRPLLRDLGQEEVFAPDQMVAWQVFSDLWHADPVLTRRINTLLPSLNSENYHERDMALGQLLQMNRDGAAVLIHLDRAHLTPEQNLRIDRALTPYAQLSAKEAMSLKSDPRFLLDCLYSDNTALRAAALSQLRAVVRPDLQMDTNADPDARYAAIQMLRARILLSPPQAAPH